MVVATLKRSLVVVLLCLTSGRVANASAILVNGSFEDGPAMDGPLCSMKSATCQDVDILAGSSAIPGWEVFAVSAAAGAVDYTGSPWDASDGAHAIDLDGRGALFSGIRQTFATIAGRQYIVTFDLSGNPGGGPATKRVRVSVGGESHDYAHDTAGQRIDDLLWERLAFDFIATGPTATLSFLSLTGTPNSYGALVDAVDVALPEPSTFVLLACAIAALAFLRARARFI